MSYVLLFNNMWFSSVAVTVKCKLFSKTNEPIKSPIKLKQIRLFHFSFWMLTDVARYTGLCENLCSLCCHASGGGGWLHRWVKVHYIRTWTDKIVCLFQDTTLRIGSVISTHHSKNPHWSGGRRGELRSSQMSSKFPRQYLRRMCLLG